MNNYKSEFQNNCAEGNQLFKKAEFMEATKAYSKALLAIDFARKDQALSQADMSELSPKRINCLNNQAMAFIKLRQFKAALKYAQIVLQQQPNNIKALYRQGVSLGHEGDYQRSVKVLERVKSMEPSLANDIQTQIQIIRKLQSKDKQKRRKMASQLLNSYESEPGLRQKGCCERVADLFRKFGRKLKGQ